MWLNPKYVYILFTLFMYSIYVFYFMYLFYFYLFNLFNLIYKFFGVGGGQLLNVIFICHNVIFLTVIVKCYIKSVLLMSSA